LRRKKRLPEDTELGNYTSSHEERQLGRKEKMPRLPPPHLSAEKEPRRKGKNFIPTKKELISKTKSANNRGRKTLVG